MEKKEIPRYIQVKGTVYRRADTVADKLLALSVEMQDYALPNLEAWTDLANQMLAALEIGKDSVAVGGKEFTAQQLLDTLQRLLKQTQEQHQQIWREKERSRRPQTAPVPSRTVPEFYRDPEFRAPTVEIKPPTSRSIATAGSEQITFRGASYRRVD